MVFDDSISLVEWLSSSSLKFIIGAFIVAVVGVVFSYLTATLQYGPSEAFYFVSRVIFQIIPDFVRTSFGRIFALAKLAVQETLRKKIIFVAFAIFAAMLLGGGWFLNANSEHPDQVYIGFVFFGTQLLMGLFGLLIATFSLPTDIKTRTIYTVVTKPVRSSEIVLGRVAGFGFVGTIMLFLIWFASYLFVERGLNHTHNIKDVTFTRIETKGESSVSGGRVSLTTEYEGKSGLASSHWHLIEVSNEGLITVQVPPEYGGHSHDVMVRSSKYEGPINDRGNTSIRASVEDGKLIVKDVETDEPAEFWIGPPTGILMARERIRASELTFLDRRGNEKERGVNVGNEWEHRSYIAGGSSSLARAVFTLDGFVASKFADPNFVQLDLNNMSVVRTHKGDIERGVSGSLVIRGVTDNYEYRTEPIVFEADEFAIKTIFIPRIQENCSRTDLNVAEGEFAEEVVGSYDLFDEIGETGDIQVIVRCNESGQFFGVAMNDLYFLTSEGSFAWNFAKAYFGIWLQMMFIVAVSVMFSTFLSGVVSMVAVLATIILGCFSELVVDLRKGVMEGGGPIESFYRIYTQMNQMTPLDEGVTKTVIKSTDGAFLDAVQYLTFLVPDFTKLDFSEPLVAGFNISMAPFLIATTIAAVFIFMTVVIGYFILKTREIAK
ncbi:hypothetical protein OAG56_05120 [Mariniblastus sp.]|jgi:hypothetical protein|nr:hypothetical protein [Mariniblastus sp.]MDB4756734.1 hypothetical protein [Mariniblastus sp.]